MGSLFIEIFYQPFLNLLVGLYYLMQLVMGERVDMGITVIMFTIIIRILLLPLTISGSRSEKEKYELELAIEDIKRNDSADPIARDAHTKALMKSNRRVVISSSVSLGIQVALAIILWRIFATGLLGRDFHLLYRFMPQPKEPFHLIFLGQFDLTKPNPTLNLIQSFLIFLLELEVSLFSSFPVSRKDVLMTQFMLPIGSYLVFSQLPAGKKLFVITTLVFSICYTTLRQLKYWWHRLTGQLAPAPAKVEDAPKRNA